ncbi:hypothetical protein EXIGLDRAFT_71939 [Exidia glandulosa HHB12029]|uniref:Uncharacterized protein n=1 Tax=Exidia glandulosa HHB12029 TaxID=1314781 RepID=A0A165HWW9_EXIGL|nr:hypothetical protein EXIGLDRAFT_71939 [Exidia glandulosa HHB12029]
MRASFGEEREQCPEPSSVQSESKSRKGHLSPDAKTRQARQKTVQQAGRRAKYSNKKASRSRRWKWDPSGLRRCDQAGELLRASLPLKYEVPQVSSPRAD